MPVSLENKTYRVYDICYLEMSLQSCEEAILFVSNIVLRTTTQCMNEPNTRPPLLDLQSDHFEEQSNINCNQRNGNTTRDETRISNTASF
jgi:hypothetical protein